MQRMKDMNKTMNAVSLGTVYIFRVKFIEKLILSKSRSLWITGDELKC